MGNGNCLMLTSSTDVSLRIDSSRLCFNNALPLLEINCSFVLK